MKPFKILAYLYRYAKALYDSDGLRQKDLNESAQLKASAQILKSNLQLIAATEKISAALEILGRNLEKLVALQADANSQTTEDQLNELNVRARLISEHQVPNLVSLINENKRMVSKSLLRSSSDPNDGRRGANDKALD